MTTKLCSAAYLGNIEEYLGFNYYLLADYTLCDHNYRFPQLGEAKAAARVEFGFGWRLMSMTFIVPTQRECINFSWLQQHTVVREVWRLEREVWASSTTCGRRNWISMNGSLLIAASTIREVFKHFWYYWRAHWETTKPIDCRCIGDVAKKHMRTRNRTFM